MWPKLLPAVNIQSKLKRLAQSTCNATHSNMMCEGRIVAMLESDSAFASVYAFGALHIGLFGSSSGSSNKY